MNENLDLTKILEGCPKGTKFYSSVFGEVRFDIINTSDEYTIKLQGYNKYKRSLDGIYYTKEGNAICAYDGECTLFPSKDQRDWSKFERFWDKPEVERFDPKNLKPFDKVIAKENSEDCWSATFFSHMVDSIYGAICCDCFVEQCIPYNDETKHLVGTKEDCPEFYKWWEE